MTGVFESPGVSTPNQYVSSIVLASASPRRRLLMAQLGIECRTVSPDIDESVLDLEDARSYVLRMAREKALAATHLQSVAATDLVIAADTCILLDAQILGKPKDEADAINMLQRLSAREHQVLSAVCVYNNGNVQSRLSDNRVRFRPLSESEIRAYCRSGEPLDKAGAYAIQGRGAAFIAEIHGSYSAIMGLPLFEVAELLALNGIQVWD